MGVRGEVAIKGVGGEDVAGERVDVEAGPCTEGGSGGVVIGLGFECWNKGLGSKTFSRSGRSCLWLCTRGSLSTFSGGRGLGRIGTRPRFRFREEILWQEDDDSKNAIRLEFAFAFELDVVVGVWAGGEARDGRGREESAIKCCSSTFDRCSAASFRLSSIQR